jgi:hypothetical protein
VPELYGFAGKEMNDTGPAEVVHGVPLMGQLELQALRYRLGQTCVCRDHRTVWQTASHRPFQSSLHIMPHRHLAFMYTLLGSVSATRAIRTHYENSRIHFS